MISPDLSGRGPASRCGRLRKASRERGVPGPPRGDQVFLDEGSDVGPRLMHDVVRIEYLVELAVIERYLRRTTEVGSQQAEGLHTKQPRNGAGGAASAVSS